MRKSTLFISAVLTTFTMATLAGVASAYQKIAETNLTAATQTALMAWHFHRMG